MSLVIAFFYGFLVLAACLGALFVVFHLVRYSLSRTQAVFMVSLFLTVFVVLLVTNIILFANLPLDTIFGIPGASGGRNGY